VAGNFIGTDLTGKVALDNQSYGVRIDPRRKRTESGPTATAGGRRRTKCHLGNDKIGVYVALAGTDENIVAGNFIGTDVTGTVDLGNGEYGVAITSAASRNRGRDQC